MKVKMKLLSVRLFATRGLWPTSPPSMGFSGRIPGELYISFPRGSSQLKSPMHWADTLTSEQRKMSIGVLKSFRIFLEI